MPGGIQSAGTCRGAAGPRREKDETHPCESTAKVGGGEGREGELK